jgi:hypothetical protein
MSIPLLKNVLFWCLAFNYSVLILWVFLIVVAHDPFYRLNSRLFGVSAQAFDTVNYAGIVGFKSLVLIFNLGPYIGLLVAT